MLNKNGAIRPSWAILCELLNNVPEARANVESTLVVATIAQ